jgi:hypothetical protein
MQPYMVASVPRFATNPVSTVAAKQRRAGTKQTSYRWLLSVCPLFTWPEGATARFSSVVTLVETFTSPMRNRLVARLLAPRKQKSNCGSDGIRTHIHSISFTFGINMLEVAVLECALFERPR